MDAQLCLQWPLGEKRQDGSEKTRRSESSSDVKLLHFTALHICRGGHYGKSNMAGLQESLRNLERSPIRPHLETELKTLIKPSYVP